MNVYSHGRKRFSLCETLVLIMLAYGIECSEQNHPFPEKIKIQNGIYLPALLQTALA